MDHRQFLADLPPGVRAELTARSTGKGLRALVWHGAAIVGLATYVAFGAPLWPLALLPLGIALAFLFTLQHECTHKTPFAAPWLNEAVGHVTGLILFQPFLWFRAFHMAHHRFTNDPQNDPELASPPPTTKRALIWHLSTLGYWRAKATVLMANALGRADDVYVPSRQKPLIRAEARLYLLVYLVAAVSLLASPLLFWIWVLPLALGFPILRLYLLAEHGRCPQVANMFENTRTTRTNRIVRRLAWNMPYHAEHHAWPAVPFHNLPALHALTHPHLAVVTDGYGRFARETVAALDQSEP